MPRPSGKRSVPRAHHCSLLPERLRKDRFGHAADATGIEFLCRVFPESLRDASWTRAGGMQYVVTHSWKQEEGTLAQRLGGQHPIHGRSHRIILALQDQCWDGTPDRLLLDCRDRFHPPELTD